MGSQGYADLDFGNNGDFIRIRQGLTGMRLAKRSLWQVRYNHQFCVCLKEVGISAIALACESDRFQSKQLV